MKQLQLLSLSFFVLSLFSCKKEDNPSDKLSSNDPAALSAGIKIWHGTRLTGEIPLPNANGPMVEGPQDHVIAFGGKYAVVQPTVYSGDIKGYYVKIDGAPDYFKVDYTQPRISGREFLKRKKKNFGRNIYDSSIVLILPPNIQTPDTFCITYFPYDSLNNVGNPISTCIVVAQLGGNNSTNWIQGSWRMFATKDSLQSQYDTIRYNRWFVDNFSNNYYCVTDPGGSPYVFPYCDPSFSNCSLLTVRDSSYYIKNDFILNNNGGMEYRDQVNFKGLDYSASTCSSMLFIEEGWNDITTGGWSITGNKMIIVFEYDEDGLPANFAWEYNIIHPDNNTFILNDGLNANYTSSYVFKRL